MGADLIRIEKDGHIIEATERAYEVVYKFRGYKPVEAVEEEEEAVEEEEEAEEAKEEAKTGKGKKQAKDK